MPDYSTQKNGRKGDGAATRIKKGQVNNPYGAQGKNYAYTQFKKLTRDQLQEMANLLLWGNMEALKALQHDPTASALASTISSVIVKIHEKGDVHSLDVLLNRMIGKVKETIELSPNEDGKPIVQITLPSNGREKIEDAK